MKESIRPDLCKNCHAPNEFMGCSLLGTIVEKVYEDITKTDVPTVSDVERDSSRKAEIEKALGVVLEMRDGKPVVVECASQLRITD